MNFRRAHSAEEADEMIAGFSDESEELMRKLKRKAMEKQYLGDSVYAEWNGYGVVLTTENGLGASNTIVLEPETWLALVEFCQRVAEKIAGTP